MSKNILIPWSGGMDSTYLMLESLKNNHTTYYTTLDGGQAWLTGYAERKAVQALRRQLVELFPERTIIRVHSELEVNFSQTSCPFKQLPAWLFHVLGLLGKYKFDEIWLGYVMGDDAAYTLGYLEQAWEPLVKALYGPYYVIPKLMMPIAITRKTTIYSVLTEHGLLENTWHCELAQPTEVEGEYAPCGLCPSCLRHTHTLAEINNNGAYQNKASMLMASAMRISSA